jgi:Tfp pilus assembly protein PilV
MQRKRRLGGASGTWSVEALVSATVLVFGALGFAATVVYARALERSTDQLWHSASAAASALEEIRAESRGRWASLESVWDQRSFTAAAVSSADEGRLRAHVTDSDADLDDPSGMWAGATARPNFLFVRVETDAATQHFARALRFQTYVSDRSGWNGLQGGAVVPPGPAPSGPGPAPGPAPATPATEAEGFAASVVNVTLSGPVANVLRFELQNGNPSGAVLKNVQVMVDGHPGYERLSVNGEVLYDDQVVNNLTHQAPGAPPTLPLAPGPVSVEVHGAATLASAETVVRLRFRDLSVAEYRVRP